MPTLPWWLWLGAAFVVLVTVWGALTVWSAWVDETEDEDLW